MPRGAVPGQVNRHPLDGDRVDGVQVYRFIYYRLYSWNMKTWGDGDLPHYNVCLWLALASVLNVLSVALVLRIGLGAHAGCAAVLLFALSAVAHYLYFVRTGRYERLAAEFSRSPLSPSLSRLLPWLYAAGAPAVFLVLLAALGPVAV
jgi:hypothetical protein